MVGDIGEIIHAALKDGVEMLRLPGASIAAQIGEREILSSIGRIENDGAKYGPQSFFRIGCLTKMITAIQVMILHQEKLIDIDDPISKHLPEIDSSCEGVFNDVTIQMLLSHTSGLGVSFTSSKSFLTEIDNCTVGELFIGSPGQIASYSSFGYEILGALIERKRQCSWSYDLKNSVFSKLNISCYQVPELCSDMKYAPTGEQRVRSQPGNTTRENSLYPSSGGALALSAVDVLKFAKLFISDEYGSVLQPKTASLMLSRLSFPPIDHRVFNAFGLGVMRYQDGTFGMSGNGIGNHAILRFSVEKNLAFSMVTNYHPAQLLYQHLYSKIFTERRYFDSGRSREAKPLAGCDLDKLKGKYISGAYSLDIEIEAGLSIIRDSYRPLDLDKSYENVGEIVDIDARGEMLVRYGSTERVYQLIELGSTVFIVDSIWLYRHVHPLHS